MSLGINTNIASLSAQRALGNSQSDAATAMQRLTTGLRINSAKDDAAGLAVANAMTSQIKGLQQASRNSADAIAMLQTAEGGMQSITDNLQRIRELAVQAASDSITDTERGYLNKEVVQLRAEIDRVANSTTFNGATLLNGNGGSNSNGSFAFQIGSNNDVVKDRLSVSIADVNSAQLGASSVVTANASVTATNAVTGAASAGDITVKVGTGTQYSLGAVAATGSNLAGDYVNAFNSIENVTASAAVNKQTLDIAAAGGGESGDKVQLIANVNGTDYELFELTLTGGSGAGAAVSDMVAALNTKFGRTGGATDATEGTYSTANLAIEGVLGSNMKIWSTDGSDVKLKTVAVESTVTTAATVSGAALDHGSDTGNTLGTFSDVVYGKVKLESSVGDITIDTANGGTDYTKAGFAAGQVGNANRATITLGSVNINDVAVDTQTAARSAIEAVDGALGTVNSARADLGAAQSRFESVISNVDIAAENTISARSRVLDADFAKESAELAKTQVLQQAGISVLAQANAMPQQVLALLQ